MDNIIYENNLYDLGVGPLSKDSITITGAVTAVALIVFLFISVLSIQNFAEKRKTLWTRVVIVTVCVLFAANFIATLYLSNNYAPKNNPDSSNINSQEMGQFINDVVPGVESIRNPIIKEEGDTYKSGTAEVLTTAGTVCFIDFHTSLTAVSNGNEVVLSTPQDNGCRDYLDTRFRAE